MNSECQTSLVKTITQHLPRELCMAVDEGFRAAAARAHAATADRDEGHRPSFLGQARHFHLNEAFALALSSCSIAHNPLKGNAIVVGRTGPLLLGRFSVNDKTWNNARRSAKRLELARRNLWLEDQIQPSLLEEQTALASSQIAVFFVSVFSGNIRHQPDQPLSIDVIVPDVDLTGRLFGQPINQYLANYAAASVQEDNVRVTLKKAARRQIPGGTAS